ncbi:MAG: aspartate aminotransferase family protein [Acetobacterales bacterium]
MSDLSFTNSPIVSAYRSRTPGSATLAERAAPLFPSGIVHDSRHMKPYQTYVNKASGPLKWDVDGNEYVDFVGGHGAMILGHAHPEVTEAVCRAAALGSHYGAGTENELRWAELVKEMVPCAERVRFTSSGTEATHLALRLARAHTGKKILVRFHAHFHGWHDHMAFGVTNHFDGSASIGVLPHVAESVRLAPPGDIEGTREVLDSSDDIAAVILEPTGSKWGQVPLGKEFLEALREMTRERGIVLIFDEVVSGFRCSRGGAQGHYGVTPDMSSLAKIVAGGMPGGACVGSKEIMDGLDFEATAKLGKEKIAHPGTYNANPVSAAAGITCLNILNTTDVHERINAMGRDLRGMLTQVLLDEGVAWGIYGSFSEFHIFTNPQGEAIDPANFDARRYNYQQIKAAKKEVTNKLRLAMMNNGVDLSGWPGGNISAAHTGRELERTADAFRTALKALKQEGEIAA